jgi:hypothetical protein
MKARVGKLFVWFTLEVQSLTWRIADWMPGIRAALVFVVDFFGRVPHGMKKGSAF